MLITGNLIGVNGGFGQLFQLIRNLSSSEGVGLKVFALPSQQISALTGLRVPYAGKQCLINAYDMPGIFTLNGRQAVGSPILVREKPNDHQGHKRSGKSGKPDLT